MKTAKTAVIGLVKSRIALSVAATIVALASTVSGRSCIVNAGTENYVQSADHSQAQSVAMSARTTCVRATDYANETRRRTSSPSAGRNLSTMPPGGILSFR